MLKFAVIGPESTGKTELCRQLAAHFHCEWEPETAREYVERLGHPYTFDDVCRIAELQIEQEKKYEGRKDNGFVFFDTDLIVTKVWFEFKYDVVPEFVTNRLAARFFDFYLLCLPDIPWVYDPVREHESERTLLFDWYEKEIVSLGTDYAKIGGLGEERLKNALQVVKIFDTSR